MFTIVLVAGVISCSPDDFTLDGLPKQGPVVAGFNVPALLFAGVPTDVSARVNGTETNPVTSVLFEVFEKGGTEVLKSGTITPTTTAGAVVVVWTGSASGISTLPGGDYMFRATGTNANGSTVSQTYFTVPDYVVDPLCQQVGYITVIMLTPQVIPATEDVGAVGSFAGSGWGTDTYMVRIKDGVYCAALPLVPGDAFKFRINASWGQEEKSATCGGAPDRTAPGGTWPSISVQSVPKWGGFGC